MKNWKTSGLLQALGTAAVAFGVLRYLTAVNASQDIRWMVFGGLVVHAASGLWAHFVAEKCPTDVSNTNCK